MPRLVAPGSARTSPGHDHFTRAGGAGPPRRATHRRRNGALWLEARRSTTRASSASPPCPSGSATNGLMSIDSTRICEIDRHPPERDERVRYRIDIAARRAAIAREQPRHPRPRDERPRLGAVERRARERHVLHQLEQHAAAARHARRAPSRDRGAAPSASSTPPATCWHTSTPSIAVDAVARGCCGGCGHSPRSRSAASAQVEQHAAHIRFVRHRGRRDLEHDRKSDLAPPGSRRLPAPMPPASRAASRMP